MFRHLIISTPLLCIVLCIWLSKCEFKITTLDMNVLISFTIIFAFIILFAYQKLLSKDFRDKNSIIVWILLCVPLFSILVCIWFNRYKSKISRLKQSISITCFILTLLFVFAYLHQKDILILLQKDFLSVSSISF